MHCLNEQTKIHSVKHLARSLKWLVLLAVLTACGAVSEPESTALDFETDIQVAVEISPPLTPVSQTGNSTMEGGEPSSDHCVDCHRDKQQLIDTAEPEEVKEAESSGEG